MNRPSSPRRPRATTVLLGLLLGSTLLSSLASAQSTKWEKTKTGVNDFFLNYVEIGLALNFYGQVDSNRSSDDTYLGTINELDLDTGPLSINSLRFQFLLPKNFRIELGWSSFDLITGTIEGDTDGTFTLNGPRFMALYRADIHRYVKPVIGLGFSLLNADFEPESAFYYGFSGDDKYTDYQDWRDSGSPQPVNGGYHKNIVVEDTVSWQLRLGLDVTYFERWVLGVDYEYIAQNITGDYILYYNDDPPFRTTPNLEFPASLHSFSIYARYDF